MSRKSTKDNVVRVMADELGPMTEDDRRRLERARNRPVDPSDAPERTEEDFARRQVRLVPITIRLDKELVDWFKGGGGSYQTRMRSVLRRHMTRERVRQGGRGGDAREDARKKLREARAMLREIEREVAPR